MTNAEIDLIAVCAALVVMYALTWFIIYAFGVVFSGPAWLYYYEGQGE